jgi:hypothetical protein
LVYRLVYCSPALFLGERGDELTAEGRDVAVDFVVDDDASVVESYGGYRVEPFEGDPWDEELLRVPEAVEVSSPRAAAP